jgi:hypothetical protein
MGCGASSGMKYEEYDFAELPIGKWIISRLSF